MLQAKRTFHRLKGYFDELPLSYRFAVAFALPVAAILWMSVANVIELRQTAAQLQKLNASIALISDTGKLLGALQNERNASVLYIASDNQQFSGALAASRQQTDKRLTRLSQQLTSSKSQYQQLALYRNVNEIVRGLAKLPQLRTAVDDKESTRRQVNAAYSIPVGQFNQQISMLSRDLSMAGFARALNAYFILNRLRELIGQERELLGSAIVRDDIAKNDIQQLIYLMGRQQSLLVGLQSQSSIPERYSLSSAVSELRDGLLAVADNPETLMAALKTKSWLDQQGQLLDKIQRVEQKLIDSVKAKAKAADTKSSVDLLRYLIIAPLTLFAALVFSWLILRHVRQRLTLSSKVFNHTQDRITVTDPTGVIVDVNPAFSRVTGYTKREVLGQRSSILQSGKQTKSFYKAMWEKLLKDGAWQGELWNRRKNGEIYAELTSISAIKNQHGQIQNYIGISSDITDRAFEHQRQLEFRAYHDSLTGLPNVMLVRDRLEHALNIAARNNENIVVASLDIDNFKYVNSRFGHVIGDQVIEALAKRLNGMLREGDTLGRVTGDEFLMVIEERNSLRKVHTILERMLKDIPEPLIIDGNTVHITASIGATVYPEDNTDADTLIRHSTQSLHHAKRDGRNQISWFDAKQEQQHNQTAELISRLNLAMQRNELELFYQPKVNMSSCEIIGVEALLRWRDPERGLVSPGEFLPVIEEHPFSIQVGNWVAETAIAQCQQWQDQGLTVPVSINVNALQLLDEEFIDSICERLKRYPDVGPELLELEVLESAAIGKIHVAAKVLKKCKRLGINVSLDDFGTGFAALDYLKRLPAQTLKIDQSFVRDMLNDESDLAIVKGIIGLAKAFGFGIIAEGIETEQQGLKLLQLGCQLGQGFDIARPMPADQLVDWIENWKCYDSWRNYNGT